ncbi:MAG TPA: hypothetical protein VFA07_18335 [Chthonomonadaceae bacterium]|nr:hypothetical protein [Chthonomonadaceae bacterium]
MRLVRFDAETGQPAGRSRNVVETEIACCSGQTEVSCFHFGSHDRLEYRRVLLPQLLLIVEGEGWIRSEEGLRVSLQAGQAVYFETGDCYEAGTDSGMTLFCVQNVRIDSTQLLPVLPPRFFDAQTASPVHSSPM